jgi:hypothetical protein
VGDDNDTGRSGRGPRRLRQGDLSVTLGVFKSGPADADYAKRLAVEQYRRLP